MRKIFVYTKNYKDDNWSLFSGWCCATPWQSVSTFVMNISCMQACRFVEVFLEGFQGCFE